jgi:hypothetical protein
MDKDKLHDGEEIKAEPVEEKPQADTEEVKTDTDSEPSFKEVMQQRAREDEQPSSSNFTLRKILGGDILTAKMIRRHIWLIVLIVFFMIIYISNRYSCQKDLLELDKLQNELKDAKYRALSSSSQLTEKSRESYVLEALKNNKDSVLHIANQPPYIINVPEE